MRAVVGVDQREWPAAARARSVDDHHVASWKTSPKVCLSPVCSVLTPWRIGAAVQPRVDRIGRSRVVKTIAVSSRDRQRRRSRLGAWALLDDDELPAAVVVDRRVEPDHDLQGKDQFAIEVAVECVPVAGLVAQHQRRRSGLACRVALRDPRIEVVGPRGRLFEPGRPVPCDREQVRPERRLAVRRRPPAAGARSSGTALARSGGGPCRWSSGTARRGRRARLRSPALVRGENRRRWRRRRRRRGRRRLRFQSSSSTRRASEVIGALVGVMRLPRARGASLWRPSRRGIRPCCRLI